MKNGNYNVYVPNNATGSTDVIVYFPGDGGAHGSGYDAKAMEEYIATNPDKVVIVSETPYHINSSDVLGILKDIENSGVTIDNVNFLGHSAGQNTAVDVAADAVKGGFNVNSVVSLDSAFCAAEYQNKGSQAQILGDNGVKLIMFDQKKYTLNHLQKFTDAGVPIVYVFCDEGNGNPEDGRFYERHAEINGELVENGLIDFICGDSDDFKGGNSFKKYEYVTYDSKAGKWITISKAEAEKLMQEGVLSSLDYVSEKMSEINKTVNSSIKDALNISLYGDSTTRSPQINVDVYNDLTKGISKLCDNLYRETIAIVKAATKYEELDKSLKNSVDYVVLGKNTELAKNFGSETNLKLYNPEKFMSVKDTANMKKLPESGWNSFNYVATQKDITHSMYEVNADDLDRLFQHWADERNVTDSPLLGKGEYFIKAANKYGLDVMTLVSICGKETGYGCDPNAYARMNNHNFFGIDRIDVNGVETDWGSKKLDICSTDEEGIMQAARRIREFYYDEKGFKTFHNLGYGGYAENGGENYRNNLTNIYTDSMTYILETDPLNPNNSGKDLSSITTGSTSTASSSTQSYNSNGGGTYDWSGAGVLGGATIAGIGAVTGNTNSNQTITATNNQIITANPTDIVKETPTQTKNDEQVKTNIPVQNEDKTSNEIKTDNSSQTKNDEPIDYNISVKTEKENSSEIPKETIIKESSKNDVPIKNTTNSSTWTKNEDSYTSNNEISKNNNSIKDNDKLLEEDNNKVTDSFNNDNNNKQNIETENEVDDNKTTTNSETIQESNNVSKSTNNKAKSVLTGLGITAAVGAAAGAAVYGINEAKKNNDISESDEEFDNNDNNNYEDNYVNDYEDINNDNLEI